MNVALIILAVIGGAVGLLGLAAGIRSSQCSQDLERRPEAEVVPLPLELPRAA